MNTQNLTIRTYAIPEAYRTMIEILRADGTIVWQESVTRDIDEDERAAELLRVWSNVRI